MAIRTGAPLVPSREPISDGALGALNILIRASATAAAQEREDEARRLIISRLPRTGPWFVEHPRALRVLFRIRPSLRPTLEVRHPANPASEIDRP